MKAADDPAPVRVALDLADARLAERVAEALADVAGLRVVAAGAPADVAVVAAGATPAALDDDLTAREREVLGLMAQGASNKLIARQLGISIHTAKFHVGRVVEKLDATGRTDAVAHAARLGVISL